MAAVADAAYQPARQGVCRDSRSMIERRPSTLIAARVFLLSLGVLLLGYMFLGRGFAHVGVPPVYVSEVVLAIGVICTAIVLARTWPPRQPSVVVVLLVAFLALGALRTIPYVGTYGVDALRDAVLWGYGAFALMLYVLVDRDVIGRVLRAYGWVVPGFAIWLPISWTLFRIVSSGIDPTRPGEVVPLIFFKSGDMAVHIAGSVAFLVFALPAGLATRAFLWRLFIAVPLAWTALAGWATNRGSLVAIAVAVGLAVVIGRRWRAWAPLAAGAFIALMIFSLPSPISQPGDGAQSPPAATPVVHRPSPTPRSSQVVEPTDPPGRQIGIAQVVQNFISIFAPSSDSELSGTRNFRLAWWSEIVDYTVFGPYFWDGKGFGVNLATDDGFQPTADESLRAPHNSHLTALARMGVPGFLLWLALQASFAVLLLRATLSHRRQGDRLLAAAGAWVLVYWTAMMVNTSFDPYLEGPQGGIWFWAVFGVGLVVMRLRSVPEAA
jgi:hypothetical protein